MLKLMWSSCKVGLAYLCIPASSPSPLNKEMTMFSYAWLVGMLHQSIVVLGVPYFRHKNYALSYNFQLVTSRVHAHCRRLQYIPTMVPQQRTWAGKQSPSRGHGEGNCPPAEDMGRETVPQQGAGRLVP